MVRIKIQRDEYGRFDLSKTLGLPNFNLNECKTTTQIYFFSFLESLTEDLNNLDQIAIRI